MTYDLKIRGGTLYLTRVARVGARLGQGKVSGVAMLAPPLGAVTGTIFGGLLGQSVGLQLVFLLFLPAFMWLAWRQWRAGAAEVHQATR